MVTIICVAMRYGWMRWCEWKLLTCRDKRRQPFQIWWGQLPAPHQFPPFLSPMYGYNTPLSDPLLNLSYPFVMWARTVFLRPHSVGPTRGIVAVHFYSQTLVLRPWYFNFPVVRFRRGCTIHTILSFDPPFLTSMR